MKPDDYREGMRQLHGYRRILCFVKEIRDVRLPLRNEPALVEPDTPATLIRQHKIARATERLQVRRQPVEPAAQLEI